MNTILRIGLALAVLHSAQASTQVTLGSSTRSAGPLTYRLDVRQPVEGSDKIGVDFDVDYVLVTDSARNAGGDVQGFRYNLTASATGFQDFDGDVGALDNMTGEVKAEGYRFQFGLTPEELTEYTRLAAKDEEERTPDEVLRLGALTERQNRGRSFYTLHGHYRFETTQNVDARQHVFGVGANADVPGLHRILDLFAHALGGRGESQPVRAGLAGDYITNPSGVEVGDAAVTESYPRVRFEAAWGARVFNNLAASNEALRGLRLRTTWQVHFLPDAPDALEAANRELNSFFEASVTYPISESAGLLIKYADGHLPPSYSNTSITRLGFSFTFQ